MQLNLDNLIIALCTAYIIVRGVQELYRFARKTYLQEYFPLKQASQYKENKEVYHYHLFHFAQKMINEQKAKKAAKYLRIILAENPDYQLAHYLLGVLCFQKKQYEEARAHFLHETRLTPEHPLVYFFLSKCQCELGAYAEAMQALEQSVAINHYYYPSYLLAMEIFFHLKTDPETEWNFFHQAEDAQCLIRPIWLHMAELEKSFMTPDALAGRVGFYESLEEAWQESSELKQRVLGALTQQQVFQAENLLIEGLRRNPHDNHLYQMYDQLLIMQKKYPAALSFYEQQLQRINPNPLEATLRLTDYLVFNKEYQRALAIMLDIFDKYSYAKFLHYPLCLLYNWLNEPQQALQHLKKAIYFDQSVRKLAVSNPELRNLQDEEEFRQLF